MYLYVYKMECFFPKQYRNMKPQKQTLGVFCFLAQQPSAVGTTDRQGTERVNKCRGTFNEIE